MSSQEKENEPRVVRVYCASMWDIEIEMEPKMNKFKIRCDDDWFEFIKEEKQPEVAKPEVAKPEPVEAPPKKKYPEPTEDFKRMAYKQGIDLNKCEPGKHYLDCYRDAYKAMDAGIGRNCNWYSRGRF